MNGKDLKYLRLFKDLCKKVNSSLDVNEVLGSISENATKMLNVKGCTIFLLDAIDVQSARLVGHPRDRAVRGMVDR